VDIVIAETDIVIAKTDVVEAVTNLTALKMWKRLRTKTVKFQNFDETLDGTVTTLSSILLKLTLLPNLAKVKTALAVNADVTDAATAEKDVTRTQPKSLVTETKKLLKLTPQLKLRNQRPFSFDETFETVADEPHESLLLTGRPVNLAQLVNHATTLVNHVRKAKIVAVTDAEATNLVTMKTRPPMSRKKMLPLYFDDYFDVVMRTQMSTHSTTPRNLAKVKIASAVNADVRNVSAEDVMQTLRKSLVIGTKPMKQMPQLKLRNQRPLSFDATCAIATDPPENLSLRARLGSHAARRNLAKAKTASAVNADVRDVSAEDVMLTLRKSLVIGTKPM